MNRENMFKNLATGFEIISWDARIKKDTSFEAVLQMLIEHVVLLASFICLH